MTHRRRLIAAGGAVLALPAWAHGEKKHAATSAAKKEQQDWGIAGEPRAIKRTVRMRMLDTMRFEPDRLDIRLGETVRIDIRNDGKMLHELVIGTAPALEAHAALMLKFPEMEHDEPHMVHVAPGKRASIVWHFNRAGSFEFACLIAGHYQAGMKGAIHVV